MFSFCEEGLTGVLLAVDTGLEFTFRAFRPQSTRTAIEFSISDMVVALAAFCVGSHNCLRYRNTVMDTLMNKSISGCAFAVRSEEAGETLTLNTQNII